MALIETDLILALASSTDKHHKEAVKLIKKVKPLKLSPYALIELDLLILSGKLKAEIPEFYRGLSEVLSYYGLEVISPTPKHVAKSWELRERYGITYFDSLHAATAIIENETLVSYDRTYSNVEGLRYLSPEEALRELA